MTLDELDRFCQSLPGCVVRYPFDSNPYLRAWCIGKKMFAWTSTDREPLIVQLKAQPDLIPTLIASYTYVMPGYHMNKHHWISVNTSQAEASMLQGLLEDAHSLIVSALPKRDQLRFLGD